ncbi:hypothetical protein VPNG_09835 [Cytospora leucostoma]|uniref:Uncharacterized protein n=1 Tax=Cytospora leucostoma TaxID=1230097 RepID=A0A423VM10_9PEZI|nr:hypothetical protein VPNG_09835 [Cytospora leucostoma]
MQARMNTLRNNETAIPQLSLDGAIVMTTGTIHRPLDIEVRIHLLQATMTTVARDAPLEIQPPPALAVDGDQHRRANHAPKRLLRPTPVMNRTTAHFHLSHPTRGETLTGADHPRDHGGLHLVDENLVLKLTKGIDIKSVGRVGLDAAAVAAVKVAVGTRVPWKQRIPKTIAAGAAAAIMDFAVKKTSFQPKGMVGTMFARQFVEIILANLIVNPVSNKLTGVVQGLPKGGKMAVKDSGGGGGVGRGVGGGGGGGGRGRR